MRREVVEGLIARGFSKTEARAIAKAGAVPGANGAALHQAVVSGEVTRKLVGVGKDATKSWLQDIVHPLPTDAAGIPTFKSGFDQWFDRLTPDQVERLYSDNILRDKIETQLRGGGGEHEFLMVAEAPKWKEWGINMAEYRQMTVAISDLNKPGGLAVGWKHSTGLPGSKSPNSPMVHNQLQAIIQQSSSLSEFKANVVPWAKKWLKDGAQSLPPALQ